MIRLQRRCLVLAVLWTAVIIANAADSPAAAAPATMSLAEQSQLFAETEPFLKPATPERVMILTHELEARGLSQAARDLRSMLKPADLATELLRLGQPAAALEVLDQWRKDSPRDPQALFLSALALSSQGSADLALRTLDQIDTISDPKLSTLVQLVRELTTYRQLHGKEPSPEGNPWGVSFRTDNQFWQPGQIPDEQRGRFPPDLAKNLAQLVRYMPLQGWLWGLLGEVLHAEGSAEGGRLALQRAKGLGYTPRWLVDHLRVLTDAQNKKVSSLNMPSTSAANPSSGDPAAATGWESIGSRPRVFVVIALGGIFAVLVVLLQVRQWFSYRRKA